MGQVEPSVMMHWRNVRGCCSLSCATSSASWTTHGSSIGSSSLSLIRCHPQVTLYLLGPEVLCIMRSRHISFIGNCARWISAMIQTEYCATFLSIKPCNCIEDMYEMCDEH